MANGQKKFSNFKIHTQYSICEGAIKIDDLASHCKSEKIKSIGICDSHNLCGALEFSEKISKSGTQPIIGTQINFLKGEIMGKLPLFAKTEVGYKSLIKLSSKSYLDVDEKSDPHCKISDLKSNNKDILILSGNHNGLLGKLFKLNKIKQIQETATEIKNIFGEGDYNEYI